MRELYRRGHARHTLIAAVVGLAIGAAATFFYCDYNAKPSSSQQPSSLQSDSQLTKRMMYLLEADLDGDGNPELIERNLETDEKLPWISFIYSPEQFSDKAIQNNSPINPGEVQREDSSRLKPLPDSFSRTPQTPRTGLYDCSRMPEYTLDIRPGSLVYFNLPAIKWLKEQRPELRLRTDFDYIGDHVKKSSAERVKAEKATESSNTP